MTEYVTSLDVHPTADAVADAVLHLAEQIRAGEARLTALDATLTLPDQPGMYRVILTIEAKKAPGTTTLA